MSRGAGESDRPLGMLRWGRGPDGRQGEESQRVLGFPVDWYGHVDEVWLRSLAHPIKAYKRWKLIRRLGPYAPDEDDPKSTG